MTDKLLKAKQEAKARQPTFVRADAHKKKRLGDAWRKPKGLQNKMRLNKKGYHLVVKPGYGTAASLRHTTNKGLAIVRVANMKELEALDPKTQAAELAGVGRKKKEELIEAAHKKKITLVNLSVAKYQEKTKGLQQEKAGLKAAKEKVEKVRAAKKEKAAAKAAEKKAEEAKAKEPKEPAAEEKKNAEKKEKDKILTSKKGY